MQSRPISMAPAFACPALDADVAGGALSFHFMPSNYLVLKR